MSIVIKNNRVSIAPRKVRQVADIIRSKTAQQALSTLRFCEKKNIAIILSKLINSGLSIAQSLNKYDLENLYLKKVFVDMGPSMKRVRPRAQGRAYRIKHRTSYVTIELDEK